MTKRLTQFAMGASCFLLTGCLGPSKEEIYAKRRKREKAQHEARLQAWDEEIAAARQGKRPIGVVEAEQRDTQSKEDQQIDLTETDFELWISFRLRAAKAVLKSKEALMAWRHVVHNLRNSPLRAFEPSHVREKRLRRAINRRQSMRNYLLKSLADLRKVEAGEKHVELNQPGAFPSSLKWVTGISLPDGRYRIACSLAHRLEDHLSIRAEAEAEAAQAAAVAERTEVRATIERAREAAAEATVK